MRQFTEGARIELPCEIEPGAFLGEHYVTIKLENEFISGFVHDVQLKMETNNRGYIIATIVRLENDMLSVRLPGSFFTTTGIAAISEDWAQAHTRH